MLNNVPSMRHSAFTHLASGASGYREFDTNKRRVEYVYHPWRKSKLDCIDATKQDRRDLFFNRPGSFDLDLWWLFGECMSVKLVR
jgi:hypothetical protein